VTRRGFGNLFAGYDSSARQGKLYSMSPVHSTRLIAVLFLLVSGYTPAVSPDSLFADNDAVEIRIAAPISTLMRERPDEEELDGELSYVDEAGIRVKLRLELRTRGNYRRQERTCPFAPLRLDVRKSEVEGTLFDGQDKLKLVTHCRNGLHYEQAVIREYVTYRMFNLLTDLSYRVRPLTITYVDTDRGNRENTRFGFVIENKQRFAARTGLTLVEIEVGDVEPLDQAYASLVSMFQYFAGNTDYSLIRGARGDDCCHNTTLLRDGAGKVFAVPYDFDMSGLVDARYATPNPALDLRSNRDRLYRGHCAYSDQLPDAVDLFRQHEASLYALVDAQERLTGSSRKGMIRFLDRFFATIDDTDAIDTEFVTACLEAP